MMYSIIKFLINFASNFKLERLMGKKISVLFLLAVTFCVSFSCKENKSLQELLKEETRAIDRFIKMNDLKIVEDYPKGDWPENLYFKTDDGLYFHVVDSGNGKKVKLLDEVSVRYDYFQNVKYVVQGDTTMYPFPWFSNYNYSYPMGQPYYFTYGLSQTYMSANSPMCQAWVIPLLYVSEGAVLNMIIPSSLGSSVDYNSIIPVFYKNLRFTSFN